ncbi:MAG: hypothetical protein B6D61_00650 [Bacteroidetes bacterium 4484_249]|nr:MAG: hypothetical protein B6D61_00650 [Bacteroidetes bacterium 4484_249]
MENQILLNIKDSSKLTFFIELIKNFDFVSVIKVITIEESTTEQSDEEILDGIKQAVKEINLINKGKLKSRPAIELLNEL